MKMNPVAKELWVAALRSGKYKQGKYALQNDRQEFCCLGVLCEVAIENGVEVKKELTNSTIINDVRYDNRTTTHPPSVQQWSQLFNSTRDGDVVDHLMKMNDDHDRNFNEIADWIEENL